MKLTLFTFKIKIWDSSVYDWRERYLYHTYRIVGFHHSEWNLTQMHKRKCAVYRTVQDGGLSLPPMASISSKKIRQAFLVLAISNSSLTILAPCKMDVYIHQDSKSKQLLFFARCVSETLPTLTSPTYFCTSSEPMTLMKQASVLLATARAHSVFPVPGGPNSSTPLGGSIPRLTNLSGW